MKRIIYVMVLMVINLGLFSCSPSELEETRNPIESIGKDEEGDPVGEDSDDTEDDDERTGDPVGEDSDDTEDDDE